MSQTDQQASSHWMVRLADSRLFRKLPAANIRILLEEIQKVSVRAGAIIIRQGDAGDYYYIIEAGTCRVTRKSDPDGSEALLAKLGPGNAFGEEEMVSGPSRNVTVVMATDGELLRLPKDRFIDIVRDPLVDKVPFRIAARLHNEGATWVDVRDPHEFSGNALPGAINLPLESLREDFERLETDRSYIVCGATPEAGAVGTLLLAQMGFDAVCLNEPLEQVLETGIENPSVEEPNGGKLQETPVETAQRKEAELDHDLHSSDPIPRDLYDDTYVGKSLADLIDQMHTRHRELTKDNLNPLDGTEDGGAAVIDLESFEAQVEDSLPQAENQFPGAATTSPDPAPSGPGTSSHDDLSSLMREFETRLRGYLDRATVDQREHLQRQLAERIEKVKQAAVKEVRRQTQAYRDKYRIDHTEREQAMRAQYDKLMGLAHRISRQKAELKRARRELEGKLDATNRLQHEIDGLRDALTESIEHFDELEDVSAES